MNYLVRLLLQLLAVFLVWVALVTFLGPSLGPLEISVLIIAAVAAGMWLCWRAWKSRNAELVAQRH